MNRRTTIWIATGVLAAVVVVIVGAVAYHAGMRPEQRGTAQEQFMTGRAEVIVATNAFGMGIDKADVRTVCHAAVPSSLEAYYQGRPRRPRRRPGALPALRRVARQGPARLLHPALASDAGGV